MGQQGPGLGTVAWTELWEVALGLTGGSQSPRPHPWVPLEGHGLLGQPLHVSWYRPKPGALGSPALPLRAHLLSSSSSHAVSWPGPSQAGSHDLAGPVQLWDGGGSLSTQAVPEASKMSVAFPSASAELPVSRDLCCSLGPFCEHGEQGQSLRRQAGHWGKAEWSERDARSLK